MQNENETKPKIRVRFPPSPTGFLHVGNVRTALFNYLFAKEKGGDLILRIEDTDVVRHSNEGEKDVYETLKSCGISWNEGPDKGGPNAPYKQSQRTDIYKKVVDELLVSGKAYRCFCSQERLDLLRDEAEANKRPFRYDNKCRSLDQEESKKRSLSENFVVRLKIDSKEPVIVEDLIRGKVVFSPEAIDDFVISKGNDRALYHLAVVVDDYMMGITHIIRGEDGLSNTPKHIFLQRALGYSTPHYAHLSLLLDENKKKLSKRSGNVDLFVKTLREEQGYLSEAIVNGLALLGWNPKTEQVVFTMDELIASFKLENVQKSAAVFSLERFKWLNKQHIKRLSDDVLAERAKHFVQKSGLEVSFELLKRYIKMDKERITLLSEIPLVLKDIISRPPLEREKIAWRDSDIETVVDVLKRLSFILQNFPEDIWDNMEKMQQEVLKAVDSSGYSRAVMLWPMRYVLSGKEKSAGPAELAWLLGKIETIKRIDEALVQLG